MRCKFCFATFKDVKNSILPKGHLPREKSIQVVQQLADYGFEKITFAGGEPTLCSWLPDLISTAKKAGLTTMIVTNGTKLTDEFLSKNEKYLDWIALSVDSLEPETNRIIGRSVSNKIDDYFQIVDRVKKYDFGFKINTVISQANFNENMGDFISYAMPKRWKIFQVLPIKGQNDKHIENFVISSEQFQFFLAKHAYLETFVKIVPEANQQMKGSYAMVDPAGRFYDNQNGTYQYSYPILEVGVAHAIRQMQYDFDKFIQREGRYQWQRL
jgi:radical S-adenosyl methionine domain-containing protein 2